MKNLTTNETTNNAVVTKAKKVKKRKTLRTKKQLSVKPVVTTKRKTVSVPVKEYTLVATQDTTVTGKGKTKTVTNGPVRFALLQGKDLVATTGNKKMNIEKLNKKTVKSLAPSVLPVVKKMVKNGEISL